MRELTIEIADRGPVTIEIITSPSSAAAIAAAAAAETAASVAGDQAEISTTKAAEALASASDAADSASSAADDAVATSADRVQTGLDRTQTGADAISADTSKLSTLAAAERADVSLTGVRNAIATAGLTVEPGSIILAGSEPDVLAIDVTDEDDADSEVYVVDTGTPANSVETDLISWLPTASFPTPKLCRLADGSMRFAAHSLSLQSEGFSTANWAKTGVNVSGPTGGLYTLTSTATTAYISQAAVAGVAGLYYSEVLVAKAGTASVVAVHVAITGALVGYVDLATGVVSNVGAGLTLNAYNTDESGVALPAGEWRIHASRAGDTTGTITIRIYICDAVGALTNTIGKTIEIRRAHTHRGVRAIPYLATTTVARNGVPYDWTNGRRGVLTEGMAVTFASFWSEDMTNVVWVKGGTTTVALTGTGPQGTPCSRVTVGGAGDTITQAVTSSGTTKTFQANIKRVSGTGTIEMTCNGGTTWTVVTPGSAIFTQHYVAGTTANPTVGFRFGTGGDVFDIALAVMSNVGFITSPLPTAGATVAKSADVVEPLFTSMPTGSSNTIYVDMQGSADSRQTELTAGYRGASHFAYLHQSGGTYCRTWVNDGTQVTGVMGDYTPGMRYEGTLRSAANDIGGSVNGLGAQFDKRPGSLTLDRLRFYTATGQQWLYRLKHVPYGVADDDLMDFAFSGDTRDPRWLDDKVIVRHAATPDVYVSREFNPVKLAKTDSVISGHILYRQRNATQAPGAHSEQPSQIVSNPWSVDRLTDELTIGEPVIWVVPPGYVDGKGHAQSATFCRSTCGALKGRRHLLWTQLDSASGLLSSDHRRIHGIYSDDGEASWKAYDGTAWTLGSGGDTHTLIYDPGVGNYALLAPSGDYVEFDDTTAHPGRIVVVWYNVNSINTLWLDPATGLWTIGAGLTCAMNETTAAALVSPVGDILITGRKETSTFRQQTIVTNYGAGAFTAAADMAGSFIAVSGSARQSDPGGVHGRGGLPILACARSSTPFSRGRLSLQTIVGTALGVDHWEPNGDKRFAGYVAAAWDDDEGLVCYENSPDSQFNDRCGGRAMWVRHGLVA